ncbi:MAG: polysaccharide biosynthesis/export family protein, partial [Planctomycetales bacterium]|nr:polysaccharide biosynthesis/export family protein [Planctomycetales bacterium]
MTLKHWILCCAAVAGAIVGFAFTHGHQWNAPPPQAQRFAAAHNAPLAQRPQRAIPVQYAAPVYGWQGWHEASSQPAPTYAPHSVSVSAPAPATAYGLPPGYAPQPQTPSAGSAAGGSTRPLHLAVATATCPHCGVAPCQCDTGHGEVVMEEMAGGPTCGGAACGSPMGCVGAEQQRVLRGVEGNPCGPEAHWHDSKPLTWELFGPGEYIGPVRSTHVSNYRLRVNDQLKLTYLLSRDELPEYRLQIGDKIQLESSQDEKVGRTVEVMPDGRVSLYLLGYLHVAGQTIPEVTEMLNDLYENKNRLIKDPNVTVTGVEVNTRLKDVQATVDSRQGFGGTGIIVRVAPDGMINLVGLPSPVCCQGLTVSELQHEINARYREQVGGLTVTVALEQLADKFVFIMGEVAKPDRYQLQGPTRVSGALALAGGPLLSGNQRQIVVVRHTEQWGTIATKLDLRGLMLGKRPSPADDLWVRDQDIIMIPKHPIQRANDVITLLFTNGLYAALPELGGFANTG